MYFMKEFEQKRIHIYIYMADLANSVLSVSVTKTSQLHPLLAEY